MDIPSIEECQKLVESFVVFTNTNAAMAQFYLQDDWNLERAVSTFFDRAAHAKINPTRVMKPLESESDDDLVVTFEGKEVTTEPPVILKFLSWNIDGLDDSSLELRMKSVVNTISSGNYDIVLLQEVTPTVQKYIDEHLSQYIFIPAADKDYFVATLLKATTIRLDSKMVHDFPNSVMGRHLLEVEAHIGKVNIRLLNTHLESGGEFSNQRKDQLRNSFKHMLMGESHDVTILSGDLNIRNKEIKEVGIPYGCRDLWSECGMRKECEYTWDMSRNTNKSMRGSIKPRLRFDRAFLHQKGSALKPFHFGLEGIEKVEGSQKFPSDHWGIQVIFEILDNSTKQSLQTNLYNQMLSDVRPVLTDPQGDIHPDFEIVELQ